MGVYHQYEPKFEQEAKAGCLKWLLVIGLIAFVLSMLWSAL